jgi:hypothetical protein
MILTRKCIRDVNKLALNYRSPHALPQKQPNQGVHILNRKIIPTMPLGRGIPPLSVILIFGAFKITIEPKIIIIYILKIVFFAILITIRIS